MELEAESVLGTLYAAKKYIIPHLANKCVEYMEHNISDQNACVLLDQSYLYEENDLVEKCLTYIDKNTSEIFVSEGFLEVRHSTLESVIKRDTLTATEIQVFDAVLKWATAECQRQNLEVNGANKRALLGTVLHHVRMSCMSQDEFADGPVRSDVLTQNEVLNVFLQYAGSHKPECLFPTNDRLGFYINSNQVCRFRAVGDKPSLWTYGSGDPDVICFHVDKYIEVTGVGVYGSKGTVGQHDVEVALLSGSKCLALKKTLLNCDGTSKPIPVWLDRPVPVRPFSYYTLKVHLKGCVLSHYGTNGMDSVMANTVMFSFENFDGLRNGNTVVQGQIPEIMFRV